MAVARADRSLIEFRIEFPFLDGEMAALAAAGCGLVRVDVVGDAMSPTLKNGDQVIARRTGRLERVNRGDVVGFRYPGDESKSFRDAGRRPAGRRD